VYDLLVDGRLAGQASVTGGNVVMVDMATGAVETRPGRVGTVRFVGLPADVKDVEIWLPHNETTELVALRTDAPVEAVADRGRRVWLHHGSSISHGFDAASPTMIWPAVAASLGGVELINLGLGGSALLDPFTARAMRDTPADLISVKMGINLVNLDLMRLRAFGPAVHGFLDTIREGHPTTPLLVVSPILCPIHEDTPGPVAFDSKALSAGKLRLIATGDPAEHAAGKLTLSVIRDELSRIVKQRAAEDPQPALPGRPRPLRRGRPHGTAPARPAPPGRRHPPPYRRTLRRYGLRCRRIVRTRATSGTEGSVLVR
jgi:hypothetical protein